MTETIRERLYHLLPTLYRRRDLAQGEPLRALLAVLEQTAAAPFSVARELPPADA